MEKATLVTPLPSKATTTNPPSLLDCVENVYEDDDDESKELGLWLASLEG
jgi:hypothetical protein